MSALPVDFIVFVIPAPTNLRREGGGRTPRGANRSRSTLVRHAYYCRLAKPTVQPRGGVNAARPVAPKTELRNGLVLRQRVRAAIGRPANGVVVWLAGQRRSRFSVTE